MNTCKVIQNLILTDYLDGEADAQLKARVDAHLASCQECRVFASFAEKRLAALFKQTIAEDVPADLWPAIKQRIEKKSTLNPVYGNFFNWMGSFFSTPYLTSALATMSIVLLLTGGGFFHQFLVKSESKDQGEYLISLWRSTDSALDIQSSAEQIPLEQYFL